MSQLVLDQPTAAARAQQPLKTKSEPESEQSKLELITNKKFFKHLQGSQIFKYLSVDALTQRKLICVKSYNNGGGKLF